MNRFKFDDCRDCRFCGLGVNCKECKECTYGENFEERDFNDLTELFDEE